MQQRALIVWGGWDGHEPRQVAGFFSELLEREGFVVEVADHLDAFLGADERDLDLIVPVWTMGEISDEQVFPVLDAVGAGTGLAGCHGGMCDAFRDSPKWQFLTGGNWVAHPGSDGVEYVVNIRRGSSPLVDGIPDFTVSSEQYYLHTDAANEVLATTRFPVAHWYHAANGPADVPVVWTRRWGHGRVYYNALGHHLDVIAAEHPAELMRRGLLWAAEGKAIARRDSLDPGEFDNPAKMF